MFTDVVSNTLLVETMADNLRYKKHIYNIINLILAYFITTSNISLRNRKSTTHIKLNVMTEEKSPTKTVLEKSGGLDLMLGHQRSIFQ